MKCYNCDFGNLQQVKTTVGAKYVCVILSRRHDTITQTMYNTDMVLHSGHLSVTEKCMWKRVGVFTCGKEEEEK